MDNSSIAPMPKDGNKEKAYKFTKAVLAATPIVGGTVTELLDYIVSPRLSSRKEKWLESIAEALNDLNQNIDSFDISKLRENDEFVSALIEASYIAIKNHQKEKHKMLTNAVCNTACSADLKYNQIKHFLMLIDELSLEHLLILKYLNHPPRVYKDGTPIDFPQWFFYCRDDIFYTQGSPKRIFDVYFPDSDLPYHYKVKTFRDLANSGLIDGFSNKSSLSEIDFEPHRIQANVHNTDGEDFFEYYTTPLGKSFLGYVQTNPIEK